MRIQQQFNLQPYNTFGIAATANNFVTVATEAELITLTENEIWKQEKIILGGGSNILFTKNIDGLVIKNEINYIETISENIDTVTLKVGSGVNWHQFVIYCINNNYAGIENLSLIPGTVGAAPMQNIGAYGVEVKNVIDAVFFYNIASNEMQSLKKEDCKFGYRDSIFKNELKAKIFITAVSFTLQKQATFNTSYGAIATELQKMGITTLTLKAVSDAVIAIRKSKLPDPQIIGNAGSFFKNPTIPIQQFETLQKEFTQIVGYKNENNTAVKVAAGWLIEQCGLKGVQVGNTGCHKMQALVLVNYGNATGQEIVDYSQTVINSVATKFGITLEREVNII